MPTAGTYRGSLNFECECTEELDVSRTRYYSNVVHCVCLHFTTHVGDLETTVNCHLERVEFEWL